MKISSITAKLRKFGYTVYPLGEFGVAVPFLASDKGKLFQEFQEFVVYDLWEFKREEVGWTEAFTDDSVLLILYAKGK